MGIILIAIVTTAQLWLCATLFGKFHDIAVDIPQNVLCFAEKSIHRFIECIELLQFGQRLRLHMRPQIAMDFFQQLPRMITTLHPKHLLLMQIFIEPSIIPATPTHAPSPLPTPPLLLKIPINGIHILYEVLNIHVRIHRLKPIHHLIHSCLGIVSEELPFVDFVGDEVGCGGLVGEFGGAGLGVAIAGELLTEETLELEHVLAGAAGCQVLFYLLGGEFGD